MAPAPHQVSQPLDMFSSIRFRAIYSEIDCDLHTGCGVVGWFGLSRNLVNTMSHCVTAGSPGAEDNFDDTLTTSKRMHTHIH